MAMGIPVGLLYTIGIVLAIASGAVTALSMVAQRGVLNHPQQVIPLGACGVRCGRLGKNKLWVLALLLYACATGGLYSVAGLCIPLALLSCLFVTLLVWNLYFSRYFLGEVLTRAKVGGSLVVVAGSCLCAVGASVGRESRAIELTSDDVARLYADPGGAAWFGALVLATLATLGAKQALYTAYAVYMMPSSAERAVSARGYPYGPSAREPPPARRRPYYLYIIYAARHTLHYYYIIVAVGSD